MVLTIGRFSKTFLLCWCLEFSLKSKTPGPMRKTAAWLKLTLWISIAAACEASQWKHDVDVQARMGHSDAVVTSVVFWALIQSYRDRSTPRTARAAASCSTAITTAGWLKATRTLEEWTSKQPCLPTTQELGPLCIWRRTRRELPTADHCSNKEASP